MQTIERTILKALLRDMRAAGYQPAAVWDSEEYVMAAPDVPEELCNYDAGMEPEFIARPLSDEEVLAQLDAVDAYCTVHFTLKDQLTWGVRGVLVILGNGVDVISDYHVTDGEPFERVIETIYDRIEKGALA